MEIQTKLINSDHSGVAQLHQAILVQYLKCHNLAHGRFSSICHLSTISWASATIEWFFVDWCCQTDYLLGYDKWSFPSCQTKNAFIAWPWLYCCPDSCQRHDAMFYWIGTNTNVNNMILVTLSDLLFVPQTHFVIVSSAEVSAQCH